MDGPETIVGTLSSPSNVVDKRYGNRWQYNSRSDHHSKTVCFAILLDLLEHCPELRNHALAGKIGFGINHTFHDFAQNKRKDLDLVVCTPASTDASGSTLPRFAERWKLHLSGQQQELVRRFPGFMNVPVGNALIALEAKATMTAHVRACPRLHDELNSSHNIVHGHDATTIAAGLVLVNMSEAFISPDRNKWSLDSHDADISRHRQPKDATRVVDTIKSLRRRSDTSHSGFDALGILVIDCRNDGSRVKLIDQAPAPYPDDIFSYTQLINRICGAYRSRFPLQ